MLFADGHNDLLITCLYERERGRGDLFGDYWLGELVSGKVGVQVLSVFVEDQYLQELALRRALLLIEEAWRIAADHRDSVRIVSTRKELHEARNSGHIALVLALEGCEPIGRDPGLLDTFFRLGVRLVSLTWNRRNALADGQGEGVAASGLTSLGKEALMEIRRLGLILDVSHLSDSSFWDVLSHHQAPLMASHSSVRSVFNHPRNLTDAQLMAIRDSKGIVCVNAHGPFLGQDPGVPQLIQHVKQAIALIGPAAVGFGFDFAWDLLTRIDPLVGGTPFDPKKIPWTSGLTRPSDLTNLEHALREELGSVNAAQVAGENLVNFLNANLHMG